MDYIVFDINFEFAIRFIGNKGYPNQDDLFLNFELVECVACFDSNTGKAEFSNYELGQGAGSCIDFHKAFKQYPLGSGYIKWDGCMELHDINHHFCGFNDFLHRLVTLIYTEAKKIMVNSFNSDLANMR